MSEKIQKVAQEKRYKFKIISSRDASGKINVEFAWEPDQGLGTGCHDAADALLRGKASESGEWNDPAKIETQGINSQYDESTPLEATQGF